MKLPTQMYSNLDVKQIQTCLQNKLPNNINLVIEAIADCQQPLLSGELLVKPEASESRKREFIAGRNVLKSALMKYHHLDFKIGRKSSGEPILPSQIVGSLSHKSPFVLAIAAERRYFVGLGLDLDTIDVWNPKAALTFMSEKELSTHDDLLLTNDELYSLLFSIKESIFKVIAPIFRQSTPSISKITPRVFKENNREFSFSFVSKGVNVKGKALAEAPWIISVAWYQTGV